MNRGNKIITVNKGNISENRQIFHACFIVMHRVPKTAPSPFGESVKLRNKITFTRVSNYNHGRCTTHSIQFLHLGSLQCTQPTAPTPRQPTAPTPRQPTAHTPRQPTVHTAYSSYT